MSKKFTLTEAEIKQIQNMAAAKNTQEEIALKLGISRWDVRKAIMMKAKVTGMPSITPQLSAADQAILAVVHKLNLTPVELEVALYMPALTPINLQKHLVSLSEEALSKLFFQICMIKQAEKSVQSSNKGQETTSNVTQTG